MKLLVLCLFAVYCCFLVSASVRNQEKRRLGTIQAELKKVKGILGNSGHMFYTPPQNIESCCSLSALECFRKNLKVHRSKDRSIGKLIDNLNKSATETSLNFCDSTNTTMAPCQECTLHPRENAAVFFSRLESLIERAMTRLNRK